MTDKGIIKSRKAELPLGNLYIASFLILLSLAGASLYLFLNGQSQASSYRVSAASVLELSEQLKQFIDQERLYVIETALFFLSSQGGIGNIKEYNDFNVTKVAENSEASACTNLLMKTISPSNEMLMRCYNGREVFDSSTQGVWKCDVNIYSYKECNEISKFSAKLCCDESNVGSFESIEQDNSAEYTDGVWGQSCHQGCLRAMGEDYENKCNNLDYCGALFCKEDYLDIPETKEGVPYYYKLGGTTGGYYCLSSYEFNPEKSYNEGTIWVKADAKEVINELISLADNYFYLPMDELTKNLEQFFDKDVSLTFKLDFKGCTDEQCEFAWIPIVGGSQEYTVKGLQGKDMVNFKTDLLSIQTVPLPIEDMIDFSRSIITEKIISNYLVNNLKALTYNLENKSNLEDLSGIADWKTSFAKELYEPKEDFDSEKYLSNSMFDIYDGKGCGENPFTPNYEQQTMECLMKHASSSLYGAIQNPFTFEETNYQLRPIFRFVKTSLGGTVNVTENEKNYQIQLLSGDYQVFIKSKEGYVNNNEINKITIQGEEFNFIPTKEYDTLKKINYGKCAYSNNYVNIIDISNNYGCCPEDNYYENGTCLSNPISNDYCTLTHNENGRSLIGKDCNVNGGGIDYDDLSVHINEGVQDINIENPENIEYIEFVRIQYDNTFETITNENGETYGGDYEYYLNTADCSSGMGNTILNYSDMSDTELWYILLGLRAQGQSWVDIVENQTNIFESFISKSSSPNEDLEKIDNFLNNLHHVFICKQNNEVPVIRFNGTGSEGCFELNQSNLFLEDDVNTSQELILSTQNLEFKPLVSSAEEKIFEISKNTQYMNLPLKWIFAYNDVVTINQTNLGEEEDCNLNYESVAGSIKPKTSCRHCEANLVVDLDFTNILAKDMENYLYKFDEVFLNQDNINGGIIQ